MSAELTWRGPFGNTEIHRLHAEAFGTRVFTAQEWDWVAQVARHSAGWVVARDGEELVGFVNVVSDGVVHAWLQDVMVAVGSRHGGLGRQLVATAAAAARTAGHEWLHVDFEDHLRPFYLDACGFTPASAGVLRL